MKVNFFFLLFLMICSRTWGQSIYKVEKLVDSNNTVYTNETIVIHYGAGALYYLPYFEIDKGKYPIFNDSNVIYSDGNNVFSFIEINTKWGSYFVKDYFHNYLIYFGQKNIYIFKSIDSTFNPSSLRLVLWKQKNCGFDVLHFHNCGFKDPIYDATNGILYYKKYRFYLFKVNKKINISKLNVTRKRNYKGYGYQEYKWHYENK
jgi:hypothetical protein